MEFDKLSQQDQDWVMMCKNSTRANPCPDCTDLASRPQQGFLLAKVTKQRDNGPAKKDVRGHWVTHFGFSTDIQEAQIFTSKAQIRARLPKFWEFEAIPFIPGARGRKINKG